MAYTTQTLLVERYGARMLVQLTDRAEVATGTIDASVVAGAIAGAAAVIDGYLAGRYMLPLVEVPPLIPDLAEAIAIWKLHIAAPDPKIEADHQAAIRALKDIAAGVIRLPVAGAAPAGTGGTGARLTDRERPLTQDNMKGFI